MLRQLIVLVLNRSQFPLPSQQLTQHRHFLGLLCRYRNTGITFGTGFLVSPVRRHTKLCMLVHGAGTDLYFKHLAIVCADNGM